MPKMWLCTQILKMRNQDIPKTDILVFINMYQCLKRRTRGLLFCVPNLDLMQGDVDKHSQK